MTTAYEGVYIHGNSIAGLLDNLAISNNQIGGAITGTYIGYRGLDLVYAAAPLITQNEIFDVISAGTVNIAGMELGANVFNATVSRNSIHDIQSTNASGYGAYGIWLSSATVLGRSPTT